MRRRWLAAALALIALPSTSARTGVQTGAQTGAPSFAGRWEIAGEVQGIPLDVTCVLVEADGRVSGSCIGEDEVERKLTGTITGTGKDRTATWHFDTDYRDTAVTLTISGSLRDDGKTMRGTVAVWPQEVVGSFLAMRQAAQPNQP